jgi:hypothetical protein
MLSLGGAHERFTRGGVEAKKIGEDAASEMLAGNYDDVLTFQCEVAWSEFFLDVAWDYTFLVVDPAKHLIYTLLATDAD